MCEEIKGAIVVSSKRHFKNSGSKTVVLLTCFSLFFKLYTDLEQEINKTKLATQEVQDQREEIEKVLHFQQILRSRFFHFTLWSCNRKAPYHFIFIYYTFSLLGPTWN
jgi:hypothetical protein